MAKIVVTGSLSKDFKLSQNFNSVGGSVGYSLSIETDEKGLDSAKKAIDAKLGLWTTENLQKQINEADKILKGK